MSEYENKKAVVIGGTIGIGLATVKMLIERGAVVLLTGRNEKNLAAVRAELGNGVHVLQSDIADNEGLEKLRETVREKLGEFDFLFVNAGISKLEPFDRVTEESFDQQFAVNTKGAFFTAQRLASLIRDGGSIVFTTVADGPASGNLSVYSATKSAVRAFAKVLAAELVPRRIRVNTVGPGFIKTPTMGVAELSDEERAQFEELGDRITPLKRHGTAEEVARAVLFLAFDATFTTGLELAVDGGLQQIGSPL